MMYFQIVFAVGLDWGIWGVLPDAWSYAGGAVITASTIWAAMLKVDDKPTIEGRIEGGTEYILLELARCSISQEK